MLFRSNNAPELSLGRIKKEVLGLIENPKFAEIFNASSKAEVAVMGQVEDKIVSGQIDRLVIGDDSVYIIDYKTNRPAARTIAEVPKAYVKQMQAYKILVQKVYPNKKIKSYILWTDIAELMEIN